MPSASPMRLGISSCLLGETVRYNGGHKLSELCSQWIAPEVEFVRFCPESAAGFGTPRPPMHLVGNAEQPALVKVLDSSEDLRPRLEAGFTPRMQEFAELDGFILMQRSPSCGLYRVKLFDAEGTQLREQTLGIFARALQTEFPLLPIEEEGRLHNPQLYDAFMLRAWARRQFRVQVLTAPSHAALTEFHARYKYLLMAHDQTASREMGHFLANSSELSLEERCQGYLKRLMHCLATPATRKNHVNALQHMLGYLRNKIKPHAYTLLLQKLEQFRLGQQPLHVPLTLLHHYAEQLEQDYLFQQQYFTPYPPALNLLNRMEPT